MKGFLTALQFLTIFPIKTKAPVDRDRLAQSAAYFPLVGLLLGLILVAVNKVLALIPLEQYLINVILVILLIVLTGGLHLDGLADTFDAFGSRKSRLEMLAIMRNSTIGTMGVLSLICIILLKLALLCSLPQEKINLALLLLCLLSRYALVLAIFLFPYAREQGKARVFAEGINRKLFALATVVTLLCAGLLWQTSALIIFLLAGTFTILVGRFISKKIGGITGDSLGAVNELAEAFVLLNILVFTKLWIIS